MLLERASRLDISFPCRRHSPKAEVRRGPRAEGGRQDVLPHCDGGTRRGGPRCAESCARRQQAAEGQSAARGALARPLAAGRRHYGGAPGCLARLPRSSWLVAARPWGRCARGPSRASAQGSTTGLRWTPSLPSSPVPPSASAGLLTPPFRGGRPLCAPWP